MSQGPEPLSHGALPWESLTKPLLLSADSRRAGVIVGAVLGSLLLLGCLLLAIWALTCCCCGGAGGARGAFGYGNRSGVGGGACGDLSNEIR